MRTRERRLLKRDRAGEGFDPSRYTTERLFADAEDGARVPISLVHRRDLEARDEAPLLLYGYGAYGIIHDATFSREIVSLLDRGFVFAIAHVRGSEILGRPWYDGGRLFQKKNTFTDYVTSAEHLVERGYGHPSKVFALGASAGGLLVGAVLNSRPDLFRGAVTHVPFVDIVTTMLDESLPLTTGEYEEWGDPRVKEHYEYMLSYSPYDNVAPREYPHLLVTAGLHDSQVQYWEPAKWVAKLRATKTGDSRLLLKTNLDAGHHGASGRYRHHRETAFEYAFLLDLLNERR
jgi:oligopeptidase B